MHPKQLIGLGKFVNNSIKDVDLYSTLIFGANNTYRIIHNKLIQNKKNIEPNILGIDITNYCSKNCLGCYIPENLKRDKKIINESLLLSAISQAKKLRIRYFGFLGGESMQEDTIPLTLIAVSKNPFLTFVYCTNSDYISHNNVSYFLDYNNVGFVLSIDGFKQTNDFIRGQGSYSNVVDASKQLKDLKRLFGASVTVRKENIEEVLSDDFVDHIIKLGFNYVVWVKYRNLNDNSSNISNEKFIQQLNELRNRTMKKPIFQQTNILGDFLLFNKKAAHHTIYLGVNGDIHIEREDILAYKGNLYQDTLENILNNISKEYYIKYNLKN